MDRAPRDGWGDGVAAVRAPWHRYRQQIGSSANVTPSYAGVMVTSLVASTLNAGVSTGAPAATPGGGWMPLAGDSALLQPSSAHAAIARAMEPLGIGVATGEHCQNRVVFKQLMQANAIRFCQLDAARLGGVNEVLAVLLLSAKFGVPVCPHAGGVGLCEYVQHLSIFDFIAVSGSTENRVIEYVDHLHEHFLDPVTMRNGRYLPPTRPGYSIEMKPESLAQYEFPNGPAWKR